MSWLSKSDRRHQEALEKTAGLHRVVAAPDGTRYEVIGVAEDWDIVTGLVLIDFVFLARAAIRRFQGKAWTVHVFGHGVSVETTDKTVSRLTGAASL